MESVTPNVSQKQMNIYVREHKRSNGWIQKVFKRTRIESLKESFMISVTIKSNECSYYIE